MTSLESPARIEPRPPALVIVAYYLWMPLIVLQAIVVAYLGLTLAQSARIGGPAWDVIFLDPPFALSLIVLIVLELGFAVAMRGGSRMGRAALVGLAVLNAAFAFLVGIPATGTTMPVVQPTAQALAASLPFSLDLAVKLASLAALLASALPFLVGARSHFRRAEPTHPDRGVGAAKSADSATPTAIGPELAVAGSNAPRRKKPWTVTLAFALWWPLIVLQIGVVLFLGRTVFGYVQMGMGSAVSMFFLIGACLPLVGLVVAESALAFAMLLRGNRIARLWLLALSIATLLFAVWPVAAVVLAQIAGTNGGIGGGVEIAAVAGVAAAVALLAVIGTALTFLPSADDYFSRRSGSSEPGESPEALTPTVEGETPVAV